ncbi:D-glycero-beta-D-manno-heptose 1-phosphate adenylyltransferase [soil metagenome]
MMKPNLKLLQYKILTIQALKPKAAVWRFKGKRVVFTNGCFDLLHRGHLHTLSAARELGDVLVVGLNTDASVKRLKGPLRPIQDETTRAEVLAALLLVDAVVLFDEETPLELIQALNPDVLVKGGDYIPDTIVGYDWVTQHGGRVEIIPLLEGHSTTGIVGRF